MQLWAMFSFVINNVFLSLPAERGKLTDVSTLHTIAEKIPVDDCIPLKMH